MIKISEEKVELEACYISNMDRSRYPSGTFGRSMSKGQPFVVRNPKAILFYNKVAKHNDWLKKVSVSEAQKAITNSVVSVDEEAILKNRQFADEKIADLKRRIALLESAAEGKDTLVLSLQSTIGELTEYKEKFEKQEAQVKKLKTALNKVKKAAKKKTEVDG